MGELQDAGYRFSCSGIALTIIAPTPGRCLLGQQPDSGPVMTGR